MIRLYFSKNWKQRRELRRISFIEETRTGNTESRKLENLVLSITNDYVISSTGIESFSDALTVMLFGQVKKPAIDFVIESKKNGVEPPYLPIFTILYDITFESNDNNAIEYGRNILDVLNSSYSKRPHKFSSDENSLLSIFNELYSLLNSYSESKRNMGPVKNKVYKIALITSAAKRIEKMETDGIASLFKDLIVYKMTGAFYWEPTQLIKALRPVPLDRDMLEHFIVVGTDVNLGTSGYVLKYLETKILVELSRGKELNSVNYHLENLRERLKSRIVRDIGLSIALILTAVSSLIRVLTLPSGLGFLSIGYGLEIIAILAPIIYLSELTLSYKLGIPLYKRSYYNLLALGIMLALLYYYRRAVTLNPQNNVVRTLSLA